MKIKINQQIIYEENIDRVEDSYIFAPSISKQKTIGGKTYNVRRIFRGGQDFEDAMRKIAVKNTTKQAR